MAVYGYLAPVRNRDGNIYHTNPHCRSFPENPSEQTIGYLESHGFEECKICSGEVESTSGGSREIFEAALDPETTIADGGER